MMSSEDSQKSHALTKPTFTEAQASALVESVFGFKVSKIRPLPSYDDQNFHVHVSRTTDTTDEPAEYVLKISNTESSQTPDLIEMQNQVIMFLRAAGFPTGSVCRTKGGNTTSLMSIGKRFLMQSYYCILATGRSVVSKTIPSGDIVRKWFASRSSINLNFLFRDVPLNSN